MNNNVRVRVKGDYALFTRPESQPERVSYDVMTPSAARNILQSIYWKPEMDWIVERIHVCRPIKRIQIMRNELASTISSAAIQKAVKQPRIQPGMRLEIERDRFQRRGLFLHDVEYVIDARFRVHRGDSMKHWGIVAKRLKRGQCFRRPYLGTRECHAEFWPVAADEDVKTIPDDADLGWMLHDIDHSRQPARPKFFLAKLVGGVMHVPEWSTS